MKIFSVGVERDDNAREGSPFFHSSVTDDATKRAERYVRYAILAERPVKLAPFLAVHQVDWGCAIKQQNRSAASHQKKKRERKKKRKKWAKTNQKNERKTGEPGD